jgi:hypothetical protein
VEPKAKAQLAKIVDELGALEKELTPLKPKLDRLDSLRRAVRTAFDSEPADQAYVADGKKYSVIVGMRAAQRIIPSILKVYSELKPKKFLEHCSFTLKALDAVGAGHLAETQLTGPRSLKVLEKAS